MDIDIGNQMIDITAPGTVEIMIRFDGQVVWVNVDGICRFRACQIKTVVIEDKRNDVDDETPEGNPGDVGLDT